MSNIAGSVLAVAALVGACVLIRDTAAGKSVAKDLNKAEANLKSAVGGAQDVVASSSSSIKQVGDDLVHLRMTNSTVAILTAVAGYAAYRLLWCTPRRNRDE